VAEEVRFFLRTAIYTLGITAIYWFLSYEIVGSTLLLSLGLSAIFFVVVGFVMIRHAHRDVVPDDTQATNAIQRTLGFDEPEGDTVTPPLGFEDDVIPSSSVWPLVTALAALLLGLGLIYGGWMWGPGIALAAVALWGWVTQLYD
jgi:Cytochrome c oxidase subunit IV